MANGAADLIWQLWNAGEVIDDLDREALEMHCLPADDNAMRLLLDVGRRILSVRVLLDEFLQILVCPVVEHES